MTVPATIKILVFYHSSLLVTGWLGAPDACGQTAVPGGSLRANAVSAKLELDFDQATQLMQKYCFECHGEDAKEANLDLEALVTHEPLVRDRDAWRRVMQLLELEAMPPEDMPQPSKTERTAVIASLDREINQFDYSQIDDPGFEPARRLTHREYNNTLRDLLGVDLRPADRFPTELTGANGFDNSANTLFLQSALMERYIAAAERVIDVALPEEVTSESHRRTRDLILVATPSTSLSGSEAAERVLRRFLRRAYRRPPSEKELQAVLSAYTRHRQSGHTFDESVKAVLPAVLISPKFLLRLEAGNDSQDPQRVRAWELASRLSYFLWASMPDDELFALAEADKLHEPSVLQGQVSRMLADPKADSLGRTVAAQWLSTRLVGARIRLDPIDNPWCTDSLMAAMRAETELFFMSLVRENRSLRELIDADYTFMNEELAEELYERDDVRGSEMRRVSLDDPNRGGILCQPAVLAVTSSYKQTSPIKRGIFVLDTVLGTPPPPPPPNAGELDEELRENERLTFREKLELHSRNSSCRACHAKIDPMGFTMENFDYFGRWRETYRRRKPIDASANLPDGSRVVGPAGLKRLILDKHHDEFVRQVVSKTLAYALGRPVDYYDEPAIAKILARLEDEGYRFQTLFAEVVGSYPFQYRKVPL